MYVDMAKRDKLVLSTLFPKIQRALSRRISEEVGAAAADSGHRSFRNAPAEDTQTEVGSPTGDEAAVIVAPAVVDPIPHDQQPGGKKGGKGTKRQSTGPLEKGGKGGKAARKAAPLSEEVTEPQEGEVAAAALAAAAVAAESGVVQFTAVAALAAAAVAAGIVDDDEDGNSQIA